MKRLLLLASVALLATVSASAQSLVLSEFSDFAPAYVPPADEGQWSAATFQSNATDFAVGDFGAGTPGGHLGNGFVEWLGDTPQDWTQYNYVTLTGLVAVANETPSLHFYIEDVNGAVARSTFALADFSSASTESRTVALSLDGIDATQVSFWGFVVGEFDNPAFGFTFDRVELSVAAIPEPTTYAVVFGGLALVLVAIRERRNRARAAGNRAA